jgi:two-component system, OmpR family, response regulator
MPALRPESALTILLADDNRDAADVLAVYLGLLGHSVRVVYDGVSAVRAAVAEPPDCAIIDIVMPGLDGYAVARELRANPTTRGIKLLALSAYSQSEIGSCVTEAGFDRHFVKGREGRDGMEGLIQTLDNIRRLATKARGLLQEAKAEFQGMKAELREVKEGLKEVGEGLKDIRKEPDGT